MPDATKVFVRPLVEDDIDDADRIFRVAFGTFLGRARPGTLFRGRRLRSQPVDVLS